MNLAGAALGGMVKQNNIQADQALKSKALDIQQQNDKATVQLQLQKAAGERLAATAKQVQDIVSNLPSRTDLPKVQQTLTALGQDFVGLAQGAGLNPQTAALRFQALVQTTPTLDEANAQAGAKAQSTAAGSTTGQLTAENTLAPQTAAAKGTIAQAQAQGTAAGTALGNAATAPLQANTEATIAAAKSAATAAGTAKGNAATADLQAGTAAKIEGAKNAAVPQSNEGKQVQDRDLLVRQYGDGSPQVQQFDALANQSNSKSAMPAITAMAKQFQTESQNFVQVRDAFGRIAAAARQPSAFGDLALLTGYMKLIDPSTGVREGEFANAQNAAGVPDRIRNLYNRAVSGERLNPDQRADLLKQAEALFHSHLVSQTRLEKQFTGLAKERGFDPKQVVIDYVGPDFRNVLAGAQPTATGGRVKADVNGNLIGVQ